MKYRLKTHDELLASGYVTTPAGAYIHPQDLDFTAEMREYASQFSPELIQMLAELPEWGGKCVDRYAYCPRHFTNA